MSNVHILSPNQPVYYKLVPNLNIIQRNVYQGNQIAMSHSVTQSTCVPNLNIIQRNVYQGNQIAMLT